MVLTSYIHCVNLVNFEISFFLDILFIYTLTFLLFDCRCTRISLALTITRTIPPLQPIRKKNIFLTYLFGVFCIAFVAEVGVTCNRNPWNWMNTPPYQCPLSVGTAVSRISGEFKFVTFYFTIFLRCELVDFIADVALMIVPLIAFWRVKLPDTTRRLIQSCFCATLLTGFILIFTASILFAKTTARTDRDKIAFMAFVFAHLIVSFGFLKYSNKIQW